MGGVTVARRELQRLYRLPIPWRSELEALAGFLNPVGMKWVKPLPAMCESRE
jgi:hypothetical protein